MIYRLVDILEDIDFGCEEREGELPLMAVAVLEDPDNNKIRFKMPDALFTKRGLQAGDSVYIDEDDTLRKAITTPDWTKEFGSKDIDVAVQNELGDVSVDIIHDNICDMVRNEGYALYNGSTQQKDRPAGGW